ncbi:hypothetical protein BCF55_0188 [Hydrogenivirga caldilitoris]|uniref:LPS export ABC transporter periplasmic protein LptC n=1 Tax=Hydrogenivirga caldilitoris TaxID=246264 RepID=A0A497XP81_9AQUI|nr:hypothetical protein [Hydrogenivirga caldilitoris]RLJ69929.1 hypothetical protein BCF55_0188 [Hydrogenivirga caldilitoris]
MKFLLLHGLFLVFSFGAVAYVSFLEGTSKVQTQEKSLARDVSIRVFGEDGEEWRVQGRELVSFGPELSLLDVLLKSKGGYEVKANTITFQRDKNLGVLKGNVEIRGEALFVKTENAIIDFSKNLLYGEGEVLVWKESNFIEGKGFKAYLKPLKVIISDVRTKHEI